MAENFEKNFSNPEEQKQPSESDLVWEKPSDEDVERFVAEIEINKHPDAGWLTGSTVLGYGNESGLEKAISESGVSRLVDLGASNTVYEEDTPLHLQSLGITEYIGVDLGVENNEYDWKQSPESIEKRKKWFPQYDEGENKPIHIKLEKEEILRALHNLPDDYSHVSMTGIENYNIIQNYDNWGVAVLAEIKRVVPENGIFYTDDGFMHIILGRCEQKFSDLYDAIKGVANIESKAFQNEENKKRLEELNAKLSGYTCPKDDEFKLGDYVLDAPEIGFRIYFPAEHSAYIPIILVNTNKTRENK